MRRAHARTARAQRLEAAESEAIEASEKRGKPVAAREASEATGAGRHAPRRLKVLGE
ncbi:hypothetical protein OAO87_04665 [bacterium]|nr:hypothetical protein [bacterium]